MTKIVDYYFTPVSPWTYLGSRRFGEIVAAAGATVRVKPVDYSVIFPQTGGLPLPKRAPARQAYRLVELERWRRHLDMPLTLKPAHFPVPDTLAAQAIIAADLLGADPLLASSAILRGVWVEEQNVTDPAAVQGLLTAAGLDGTAILAKASDSEVTETWQAYTAEALDVGVFGAPSYVVEGEIFWGQDRLDFLEQKLTDG